MKTHSTEIEGRDGVSTYTVMEFGFDDGFRLQAKLLQLVAPGLTVFDGGAEVARLGEQLVSGVLESLDKGLIDELCKHLRRVGPEGKPVHMKLKAARDAAWGGNYLEAFEAIKWVMEVNFGPFIADVGERLSGLLRLLAGPESESSDNPRENTQNAPGGQGGLLSRLLSLSSRGLSGEAGSSSS